MVRNLNNFLLEADDKGLRPGSSVFVLCFGNSIEENRNNVTVCMLSFSNRLYHERG